MSDFKEDYLLSRQDYGVLFPYMIKDDVKQIYWNGRVLSIETDSGISIAKERLSEGFTDRFSMLICNRCSKSFNPDNPVFEYENRSIYIQMIHESVAGAGSTLLIKKIERPTRPDAKSLVESGFCDEMVIDLLKDIIREEVSFLIYGHSDTKKLMRFMTRYIPPESRMLSIEGGTRLDIAALNPDKDVTELSIEPEKAGGRLLQICRGINPKWILSGDADGRVIKGMVEAMDSRNASGGLSVNRYDENEIVEKMFPWVQDKRLSGIRKTLYRAFPIRIGVDKTGIYKIVHHDRLCNVLYERSTA